MDMSTIYLSTDIKNKIISWNPQLDIRKIWCAVKIKKYTFAKIAKKATDFMIGYDVILRIG